MQANREEIILALVQFDESSKGDKFESISTEKLEKRLEAVAAAAGFTAEDLIQSLSQGF